MSNENMKTIVVLNNNELQQYERWRIAEEEADAIHKANQKTTWKDVAALVVFFSSVITTVFIGISVFGGGI